MSTTVGSFPSTGPGRVSKRPAGCQHGDPISEGRLKGPVVPYCSRGISQIREAEPAAGHFDWNSARGAVAIFGNNFDPPDTVKLAFRRGPMTGSHNRKCQPAYQEGSSQLTVNTHRCPR